MAFEYDKSYKRTADEDARGSLTILAGVAIDPAAEVESLERELNQPQLRADHLYKVSLGGSASIQHFEALAYYRSDWGEAQLDHASAVRQKHRLPVHSNLLLLMEQGTPQSIDGLVVRVSGDLEERLRVNVIRLWERPAEEVLRAGRAGLLPWTALMDATVEQQREAARRIRDSEREDLKAEMALLGALRYGSREAFLERIGAMFLTREILRESPMWKEIEQEGLAEGREQGRLEGGRHILTRLLVRRFGSLPDWAEQKVAAADLDTLERWVDRVDAATLPEILD